MANLRSDSPTCRRIVLSFLDFLNSVEPAPGVDVEGLDVARQCLQEVFRLESSTNDDNIQPGTLVNLFTSLGNESKCKDRSDSCPSTRMDTSCTTSNSLQVGDSTDFKAPNTEGQIGATNSVGGDFKDELLVKFIDALDKVNFLKASSNEDEDSALVEKAMKFFHDALKETETSEEQAINLSKLAETFKSRGNRSMQSKSYAEAIELYTCAIALCERNAVYYCNRAAAFTQINKYAEAIQDSLKSIEINPSYSKAYSRIGLAYFAQGNYADALKKGFLKALQLDPHNESVKENIQVAQRKLFEQQQQNGGQQSSRQPGESSNQNATHDNSSLPFNQSTRSSSETNPSSSFHFTPPMPPTTEFPSSGAFMSFNINASTPQFNNMFRGATPEFDNMFRVATDATESMNASINNDETSEQVREQLRSMMGNVFSSLSGSQQNANRGNDRD